MTSLDVPKIYETTSMNSKQFYRRNSGFPQRKSRKSALHVRTDLYTTPGWKYSHCYSNINADKERHFIQVVRYLLKHNSQTFIKYQTFYYTTVQSVLFWECTEGDKLKESTVLLVALCG